jgi:hypothetical protein
MYVVTLSNKNTNIKECVPTIRSKGRAPVCEHSYRNHQGMAVRSVPQLVPDLLVGLLIHGPTVYHHKYVNS